MPEDFFISNMICIFCPCPCKCKLPSLQLLSLEGHHTISHHSENASWPIKHSVKFSIRLPKDCRVGLEKELCHLKTSFNVRLAHIPQYLKRVAQMHTCTVTIALDIIIIFIR